MPNSPMRISPRLWWQKAYRNGLVVLSCGVRGNVFRFLPALTISDEGLDILEACFERLCA